MTTQVILSVPDDVYHQAENLAQDTQQPLERVLVELLTQALSPFPIHPQRAQMQQEESAFRAQRAFLLAHYPNEYVALHQGQVVDHDTDEEALLSRIHRQYPQQVVLIRQVRPQRLDPLVFRSPRFVAPRR